MGQHRLRLRARLVAPTAAAALAAAALTAGAATSATAAPNGPSSDVSVVDRVLTRATSSTPAAAPVGSPRGYQAPEYRNMAGAGFDAVNRSLSRRPSPAQAAAAARAAGALAPPFVPPTAVAGSPGLVKSFQGLSMFDQRYANNGNQFSVEPPDQGLCVGNGYALESTNDVLRIFRTSGAPASGVVDLNTFYGYPAQFDRTTGRQGPFVTDPTCVFDAATQRFYLVVLTLDVVPTTGAFTTKNHLDLAVSRTANPLGKWDIYRLPVQNDGTQGTPKHPDCPCIGDYPHIGADANGIYLTTNEYPFGTGPGVYGNNYNGAQIYALDKQALARGAARVHVVQYQNTFLARGSTKVPGFTLWPAQNAGTGYDRSNGGTEHFLSSIAGSEAQPTKPTGYANQIGVWRLSNTSALQHGGRPALTRRLLQSEVYGVPPWSEQRSGNIPLADCLQVDCLGLGTTSRESEGPLDSNDSRMQQVWYANGRVMGALDTVAIVSGNVQAAVAWFSVAAGSSTATSTMAAQGYLGVKGQNNITYPALATLNNGQGVMAFTLVGRNYYPSAAYIKFGPGGPMGNISLARLGQGPQDGFTEYNAFKSGSVIRPRWGDYGAAAVSGGTVWIASEYIESNCTFVTYRKTGGTCGNTRAALGNWTTRVSQVRP